MLAGGIARASNKDGLLAYGDPFGQLPITIPQYTSIQFQLDFTKVPPSSHCPSLPGAGWNTWYDVLYIPTNGAASEVYPDYIYPPPSYGGPPGASQGPCLTSSPNPNQEPPSGGTTYAYNIWYPPAYTFNNVANYNLTYGLYAAYCDALCQYWFNPNNYGPPVFGDRGTNNANTLNFPAPPGGFPLGNTGGDFYYYCYLLDYYVYLYYGAWPSPLDCSIDNNAQDSGNYVVHAKAGVPSGANQFNAVEPGTLDPTTNQGPIYTKIAGVGYTLDLYLFDQNGKIPNKRDQTVEIYLYDAHDNSGSESPVGSGCLDSWNRIADLGAFTFNGSDPVSITLPAYANALSDARLYILQTAGTGPAGSVSCSTDDFAIRPAYFAIQPTDADWMTPGLARALDNATLPAGATNCGTSSSGACHKAGRPFTVTLVPKNAAGGTVTGYGSPGAPNLSATAAVAPTTAAGATLGNFSAGTFSVPPASATALGEAVTTNVTYGEVGAIGLEATDSGFAAVDAGDTSLCQRTIGETCPGGAYWNGPATTGRFVPDHFTAVRNTPQFKTFCPAPGSATGGFTYVGEPFDYTAQPVITVTAKNASGDTTQNYYNFSSGDWFRLTASSLPATVYADENSRALDTAGLSAYGQNPTIRNTGRGTGTITYTAGSGIDYPRNTATAPFAAMIDLRQSIADADAVQASPGATVTFADIAWDNGAWMRYGRLALSNAYGSERMSLQVPMRVEYYGGADTGYVTNTDDSCTAGLQVKLSNFTPQPAFQGATAVATFTQPAAAGIFRLDLSAPGAGNTGHVTVAPAPATTGSLSWLRYQWNPSPAAATFPTALAVFGIYENSGKTVFTHRVPGGG